MKEFNLCQYLDWDSAFFSRRIARINANTLTLDAVAEILDWSDTYGIECLYFLADDLDSQTVRIAEDNGFHFVDIRVTLEKSSATPFTNNISVRPQYQIRPFRRGGIPKLKAIAQGSYPMTRFHFDPNFARERSDAMYEVWIEKSCEGYADAVLVAELSDTAAGYVTCHLQGSGTGNIGLVGVSKNHLGSGLGIDLINAALQWFAERNATAIQVVTQGRNRNAVRLYEKCGFQTNSMQLWYHRWFVRGKKPNVQNSI